MIETKNFAFVIKVLLSLETTCPDCQVAKIGLNDLMTYRVKVWKHFLGLSIETNNFAFEVNVISGLESTHPDG